MPIAQIYLNDVLFSLHAAHALHWPDLNRTNFQKILFLSAVLAPLIRLEWGYEFTNAPYGPFSRNIHQAADTLIHYGYAEPVSIKLLKDSKLRARYKITSLGEQEVEAICRLERERIRRGWIMTLMKVLDIYGPTLIIKLAYREPTFAQMRSQNKGGVIDITESENQSLHLIDQLIRTLKERHNIDLDTLTSKLITYFDFISEDIGHKG